MEKTTTSYLELPSPVGKPRPSTVKFLLQYSKALRVIHTDKNGPVEVNMN